MSTTLHVQFSSPIHCFSNLLKRHSFD